MKVVYFSLTGNCRKFINFCNLPAEETIFLKDIDSIEEDYILLTPTIGFGEVPPQVQTFLEKNNHFLRGVVASGNRNWGNNFALSANIISEKYNVPILMKIELLGNKNDIETFKKIYEEMKEKYDRI